MKTEQSKTREQKLDEVEDMQSGVLETITSLMDTFDVNDQAVIITSLKTASEKLHELRLNIALGKDIRDLKNPPPEQG